MADHKEITRVPPRAARDPFALLRYMAPELDRVFDDPFWAALRLPSLRSPNIETATWNPKIDVFEKDNRLVTRVDLPGVNKEDVTVELADDHLVLAGTRTREFEEKKENFYRTEREYGTFNRVIPLPPGVNNEEVTATFADGVLEVIVPMPIPAAPAARRVEIGEPTKAVKTAA